MARKASDSSIRQRAFVLLDSVSDKPRQDAVKFLMDELGITKLSYAKTLYQQHRALRIKEGTFKPVYVVKTTKNNEAVKPYVDVSYVPESGMNDGMCLTERDALINYLSNLDEQAQYIRGVLTTYPSVDLN